MVPPAPLERQTLAQDTRELRVRGEDEMGGCATGNGTCFRGVVQLIHAHPQAAVSLVPSGRS